jgi:transcriptional regulator with XRE-family HTH domain
MGRRSTADGLRSLYEEFVGSDPELVNHYERTLATLEIGVAVNRLRTEAGLTMRELAERIGTQPSAIARLERADYEGHSLGMLRKLAAALGRRVEIRFPRVEVNPLSGSPKASTAPKPSAVPKAGRGTSATKAVVIKTVKSVERTSNRQPKASTKDKKAQS